MYILINENREQTAVLSDYVGSKNPNAINVDVKAPAKYFKLKTDYENFEGENQWEEDPESKVKIKQEEKLQGKFDIEQEVLVWEEVKKNKDGDLTADDIAEIDKKINEKKNKEKQ